jgi:hypothetical protein
MGGWSCLQGKEFVTCNDLYRYYTKQGYFEPLEFLSHPHLDHVNSKYDELVSVGIACAIYVSTRGFLTSPENFVPHYYLFVRDSWENNGKANKIIRPWFMKD